MQFHLSPESYQQVSDILVKLMIDMQSTAVLLADSSGTLVFRHGSCTDQEMNILATLAAADYAATAEMARIIGEPVRFRAHFYEGQNASLYITGVTTSFFLAVIFGRGISFGMVRVKVNKAIGYLEEILEQESNCSPGGLGDTTRIAQVTSPEFQSELSEKLDQALSGRAEE